MQRCAAQPVQHSADPGGVRCNLHLQIEYNLRCVQGYRMACVHTLPSPVPGPHFMPSCTIITPPSPAALQASHQSEEELDIKGKAVKAYTPCYPVAR